MEKFTDENFKEKVLEAKGVVVVDFWAPWCTPCNRLAPVIKELAEDNAGTPIGKLNVDDNETIARKYQINSIPTVIIFKDGKVVETFKGMARKSSLQKAINDAKD